MGGVNNCCQIDKDVSAKQFQSSSPTWLDIIEDLKKKNPHLKEMYQKKRRYCQNVDINTITQFSDNIYIGKIPKQSETAQMIVIYRKEGWYYEGQIKNYAMNGLGRLISQDGDCYQGKWKDNLSDGEGTYESINPKRKYMGIWRAGFLVGKGRALYEDGSSYQGEFYQNMRHGKGKIKYSDQSIYEGDFKNNIIEGFGMFQGAHHKYQGSWLNGKMQGAGKSYWYGDDEEYSQTYEGQYLNGLKHGKGEYRWKNGKVFIGQWQHGEIKGVATTNIPLILSP